MSCEKIDWSMHLRSTLVGAKNPMEGDPYFGISPKDVARSLKRKVGSEQQGCKYLQVMYPPNQTTLRNMLHTIKNVNPFCAAIPGLQ